MASVRLRLAATERVLVEAAEGRVVAQAVVATEDSPPFDRSRVDGFAVIAADIASASDKKPVRLTVAAAIAMGQPPPQALQRGQAMRVPTGGALPPGADAVVMLEDTVEVRAAPQSPVESVDVLDGSDCRENVTTRGADVRAGTRLFNRGDVLGPASLGLAAAVGVRSLEVFVRPLVGLLITGDELAPPGETLHHGQVRDINRYSLSAALAAMGFAPRNYPRVADDRAALASAFRAALDECDAVVISGGSSVGERDYTPAVVADAGEPGVLVHGVRAKPGRPTLLAAIGDKPVIGLPGNPVSALVVLEALGKPILLRMFDKLDGTLPWRVALDEAIDVERSLEHRIPVKVFSRDGRLCARPLSGTSAQMHILGFADALVVVPEGVGRIEAGTMVDATPLSRSSGLR